MYINSHRIYTAVVVVPVVLHWGDSKTCLEGSPRVTLPYLGPAQLSHSLTVMLDISVVVVMAITLMMMTTTKRYIQCYMQYSKQSVIVQSMPKLILKNSIYT